MIGQMTKPKRTEITDKLRMEVNKTVRFLSHNPRIHIAKLTPIR